MYLTKLLSTIVLISLVSTAMPISTVVASSGGDRNNRTAMEDPPSDTPKKTGPVVALGNYLHPVDPFQMRVPGTTTSLVFGKYGSPIDPFLCLNLIANAQYQLIGEMAKARGDGPALDLYFQWPKRKSILYLKIWRQREEEGLTWLMLADMLEGVRRFFRWQGWFETAITVLDDTAGVVASGHIVIELLNNTVSGQG